MSSLLQHRVVRSGAWLAALQAVNLLIPLVTLPYVTRTLGPSQYGAFATGLNIVSYFQVLVEYGFSLSGSRKVALASSRARLETVIGNVVSTKLVLCVGSLILLGATVLIARIPPTVALCMALLSTAIVGEGLRQNWVFQGLQDMKAVTVGVAAARLLAAGMIFVLVSGPEDVYIYCLLYGSSYLLAGLVSAVLVKYRLAVRYFIGTTRKSIMDELKGGWPLFTASAMAVVFSAIGVSVLGVMSTSADVGRFAAIQRVPSVMVLLYAPLGQALFPHISSRYQQSFEAGVALVKRTARVVLPTAAVAAGILVVWREPIVELVIGSEYSSAAFLMVPLALWMFLSIANNLLGVQVLVAAGRSREYSKALRAATVVMVVFCVGLGRLWGSIGVAASTMLAESTLTVLLWRAIALARRPQA